MSNPYGAGDPYGRPQNTPPGQQYGQQYGQQPSTGYPPYGQGAWGGPATAAAPPEPSDVTVSFWLWIADVAVGLVGAVVALLHLSTVMNQVFAASGGARGGEIAATVVKASIVVGAVVGLVIVGLHVLFAVFMRRGRNWARIVLTVLGGLGVLSTIIGLFTASAVPVNGHQVATRTGLSTTLSVVQALIIIAAIVMSFRPAANAYFAAQRR